MPVEFGLLALRHRRGFALANVALEPFRVSLLPANFRVDQFKEIVRRGRGAIFTAKIAGFLRRLARVVERPAALPHQLATADTLNVDRMTLAADRGELRIGTEPALGRD